MKFLKQATYVKYELGKPIKICPNQHIDLFRFHFTEDSLKIKKGLEIVSRSHFLLNFLIELLLLFFFFVILHKLVKFHHQIVFTSHAIQ